MQFFRRWIRTGLCALACAAPVFANAALVVTPRDSTVAPGGTVAFAVAVSSDPTTPPAPAGTTAVGSVPVTWSVNGVRGGDEKSGRISPSGLYIAPVTLPAVNPVVVSATAIAEAGTAETASTKLTVKMPAPVISSVAPEAVDCGPYTLTISGSSFYPGAAVWANGEPLKTVYVSSNRLSASGTISHAATTSPQAAPSVLNIEVSNAGNVRSAQKKQVQVKTCGVTPPVPITISPNQATVALGGKLTFSVNAPSGTAIPTVSWSVNGVAGGDSKSGTISSVGVYTAPNAIPSNAPITVTATSTSTGTSAPVRTANAYVILTMPVPRVTSIAPLAVSCGPYTLTITGSNFFPGTVVMADGVALQTTYVSGTKLTASGTLAPPAASTGATLGPIGTLKVQIVNPGNVKSTMGSIFVNPCNAPPPIDAATASAARFLEQATFGTTAADVALVKQIKPDAWIAQQLAMPPSALPTADIGTDNNENVADLRKHWYFNMVSGQDQLRQRMIFALSQIFVVSQNKDDKSYMIRPWLPTLSKNAFGNFDTLLREITLNPSMGLYLDLNNSGKVPNENYAREVMQLFSIGTVMLNQDGSVKKDANGEAIPSYTQDQVTALAKALSGWTIKSYAEPMVANDNNHNKEEKELLLGLKLPANQTAAQDFDGAMKNLFQHPNVAPFIATRLIRAFVTSNPSPAYIQRVANAFANTNGVRGDLAATLRAVLLDPEARADGSTATKGRLKDPILHTVSLIRALGGKVIDSSALSTLFNRYAGLGQMPLNAPSVFNFYSPLTLLPGRTDLYGPEFQIYGPSQAVARENFVYNLISGTNGLDTMVKIDLTPFVNVAADARKLVNLVDTTLMQGRMSLAAYQAIVEALGVAGSDSTQRAITALYLTAITADFAVNE